MTVNSIEKRCAGCSKIYPATPEYFYREKRATDGLKSRCKRCRSKDQKQYSKTKNGKAVFKRASIKYACSEKGKEVIKRYRQSPAAKNSQLKYRYGNTLEDYNMLFNQQNGCCAICGKHQTELKRRLDVDHDHGTGKIRGLLCNRCNKNLGRFENGRKFNPLLTQQFMEYLNQDNFKD